MMAYILTAIAIAAAFSLMLLTYKSYYAAANISVNFFLPNKKILLERKAIAKQLDKALAKPNEINAAILVGAGGSGKTTIARNYASKQKASIIWEINAETKHSLFSSIESLAYALCGNNADKQELRSILDIKDSANKHRQLLLFAQKQLKLLPNWLIIYDNVEIFKDIADYFPNNAQSWGRGKAIITTRDATIKNHAYIDALNVISVGEINKGEKLELFKNISSGSSFRLASEGVKTEQFLETIPSFPLDVSIAAHYLRDTGMSYEQYLEEIKMPKKDFSELQASILQDADQYAKTRYSIIALTMQNMLKST